MKIKSHLKDYEVIFTEHFSFIDSLINLKDKLFVIDQKVYELYKNVLFSQVSATEIFLIEATEQNKTITQALEVCLRMTKFEAKRNATLITVGGGILQDISGFAATVLYRGVKWIFVPTTLLAQADSCIGSKSSLNYLEYKNILGTFYPPCRIYIDTGFLPTLTDKDYRSGLGEVLKLHIMKGQEGFNIIKQSLDDLLGRDYRKLEDCIKACLEYKKKLIEEDEFDLGIRRLLNYGHTFGHALETTSNYDIPHGLGVVLGILIANVIATKRGYLSPSLQEAIKTLCLKVLTDPLKKEYFEPEPIISAMKKDKKRQGLNLAAILLQNNFNLVSVQDMTYQEVGDALAEIKKLSD